MNTPNADNVCNVFFRYDTDCENCPIKEQCDTPPADSNNPFDWEERIEQAAIAYLEKTRRTGMWWMHSPHFDGSVSFGCAIPPPPTLDDALEFLPTDLKTMIKKENLKNGNKD